MLKPAIAPAAKIGCSSKGGQDTRLNRDQGNVIAKVPDQILLDVVHRGLGKGNRLGDTG